MCPGDGRPSGGWVHWFNDNKPDAAHAHFDMLPDVSELAPDELCPTAMHWPDGSAVQLYSALRLPTVRRHFSWMREYGIDGAALQRFVSGLEPRSASIRPALDRVLGNVRQAAEENSRGFFVMYDIAGANPATWTQTLLSDWQTLLQRGVPQSSAYMRDGGKLVLALAGIGVVDRPGHGS